MELWIQDLPILYVFHSPPLDAISTTTPRGVQQGSIRVETRPLTVLGKATSCLCRSSKSPTCRRDPPSLTLSHYLLQLFSPTSSPRDISIYIFTRPASQPRFTPSLDPISSGISSVVLHTSQQPRAISIVPCTTATRHNLMVVYL
jgi:hypothetical protein